MPLCQKTYLSQINSLIDDNLNPSSLLIGTKEEESLINACRHLCCAKSGKRIRPLFCFYCYGLFGDKLPQNFINIGVAAEFIHAASLMHDDIVDDASRRRGIETTNLKFGNKTAVLAGDFLLTQAFNLLMPFDRILIDKAIFVVREMTMAAMSEFNNRGHVDLSIEDVKNIALGKTALLFSWCGFASAIIGNKPNLIEDLWDLGKHIGIMFQLADDIKDFHGDTFLKDICRDVQNLDPSMPLVLAMEENNLIRQLVKDYHENKTLDADKTYNIREAILSTKAIEKTQGLIKAESDKAKQIINRYHSSAGASLLEQLVDTIITI